MSLAGSCFSPESALGPFHHGARRQGGTILGAALPVAVGRSKWKSDLLMLEAANARPRFTISLKRGGMAHGYS